MHNNLIILAAGASSRMKKSMESSVSSKEIKELSKALIGLGKDERPFIDYLMENAKKAGYTNIFLVVGKEYESFKTIFGDQLKNNKYHGLNIHYAIQYVPDGRKKPYGTADAVLQAMEQYSKLKEMSFSVCNSDNLYSVNALKLLRVEKNNNAMIRYDRKGLKFDHEKISKFAILSLDKDDYLKNIIEKPALIEDESILWVSMNIFKFHGPSIYPYLKHCPINKLRDEKEIPTAILNMCQEIDKAMYTIPVLEHVPDLTQMDDIKIVNEYLNDRS